MVARALWHLTPPENNGVETSKLTERHDGITEDTVTGGEAADAVLLSSVQCQDWLWCGVVQAGAQHSPDPIPSPDCIPPSPRPDQYNFTFPAFSGRLSSSPQQCQWKWKLNGESTGLQVFSMYRLIIMTGEGDMEFCIRILMKDKYWIPTNHVPRRGGDP